MRCKREFCLASIILFYMFVNVSLLTVGYKHNDTVECKENIINFNMFDWMIISGSVSLIFIAIHFIYTAIFYNVSITESASNVVTIIQGVWNFVSAWVGILVLTTMNENCMYLYMAPYVLSCLYVFMMVTHSAIIVAVYSRDV
jgi:hypothetical protein